MKITEIQLIFRDLLTFSIMSAAIVGIIYYPKVKHSFWKWFVFYLVFIAASDFYLKFLLKEGKYIMYIYDFLVVPIEFFFFFWLFAMKSLKKKYLFYGCIILYILTYLPHLFHNVEDIKTINKTSYNMGCLLLLVLIVLEIIKQILSDDILLFKQNKMFYINIGVLLFFIGSLPFLAFFESLLNADKELFSNYYTYFLFSNNAMYLLFAASFIWGKPKT